MADKKKDEVKEVKEEVKEEVKGTKKEKKKGSTTAREGKDEKSRPRRTDQIDDEEEVTYYRIR